MNASVCKQLILSRRFAGTCAGGSHSCGRRGQQKVGNETGGGGGASKHYPRAQRAAAKSCGPYRCMPSQKCSLELAVAFCLASCICPTSLDPGQVMSEQIPCKLRVICPNG
eukprot:1160709-Pelagomonas_calceolata.AAC.9